MKHVGVQCVFGSGDGQSSGVQGWDFCSSNAQFVTFTLFPKDLSRKKVSGSADSKFKNQSSQMQVNGQNMASMYIEGRR